MKGRVKMRGLENGQYSYMCAVRALYLLFLSFFFRKNVLDFEKKVTFVPNMFAGIGEL